MPAGVSVPANDLYPDDLLYPSEVTGIIFGAGIPSRRAFGRQDTAPRTYLYPSDLLLPGTDTDGLRLVPLEVTLTVPGIGRLRSFGVATFDDLEYVPPPDFGPVGPPRRGLTPGVGKEPGSILEGSDVDIPILYARAHFPSNTLFPQRGLYPAREDFTPHALHGRATVKGRQRFLIVKNGHFRRFVATFDGSVGFLTVHGVHSSDVSGIVPYVVELSDGKATSELAGGVEAVDLAAADGTVEMDDLAYTVELETDDATEVDL